MEQLILLLRSYMYQNYVSWDLDWYLPYKIYISCFLSAALMAY